MRINQDRILDKEVFSVLSERPVERWKSASADVFLSS